MGLEGSSPHAGKLRAEQVWREPGHRSVDTGWPVRHEVDRAAPHTRGGSPVRQDCGSVHLQRLGVDAKPHGLKQAHSSLLGLELGSQGVDKLSSETSSVEPSTPW